MNKYEKLFRVCDEHEDDVCPECGHVGFEVFVKRQFVQLRCENCGALLAEIEADDPPGYEESVRY